MAVAQRVSRKLTLDLGAVAAELYERPEVSEEELRLAREGRDLVRSILELDGGEVLSVERIANLTDEVIFAAHSIAEGGAESVALRLAAEEIAEEDAFGSVRDRLQRVRSEPDPSVAGEFI